MASERSTAHPTTPASRLLSPVAVLLVLALAGAGAYWNQFDNAFQFDDFHSIVQNPSIRSFAAWRSWFTDLTAFSVLPENLNYRPLLLLSYAISYRMAKLEVWGFHLINWLIHVGAAFLVYAIALRLFARPAVHPVQLRPGAGWPWPPSAAGMAAVAGLVFLVHPANSEPVNYISSRSESLATLFVLLAFLAYLGEAGALVAGRPRRAGLLALACAAAFTAGLLTKEIAITLPALVVLHDLVLGRAEGAGRRLAPARLLTYALLAVIAIAYLLIRAEIVPPSVAAARSGVAVATYFFTQIRAWVHYAGEFLWPARLTADNTDFGWSTGLRDRRVALALAVLAGLALSAFAWRKRNRLHAFGLLWFLVTLLPTSSVFPLAEPVNGHRAYLPAVGLTLAAVTLAFALAGRLGRLGDLGRQGLLSGLLGAALALLVVGTLERNRVWDSARSLWEDVVAKSPGNGRAHMNLGLALMEAGELDRAAVEYDLAVARAPGYAMAYVNRAILRRARGDLAGATADIERSLALGPDNIFVRHWAGKHYAETGDLARAAEELARARVVSPRHAETLKLLLDVEARRGRADELRGLLAALDSLGVATDSDRERAAFGLLSAARHGEAARLLEGLVERAPDDPRARYNLAYAYLMLERYADAERELKLLLTAHPESRDGWQNLLWIYRVTGRPAAHDSAAAEMARALGEGAVAAGGGRFRATLPAVLEVPAAGSRTAADTLKAR